MGAAPLPRRPLRVPSAALPTLLAVLVGIGAAAVLAGQPARGMLLASVERVEIDGGSWGAAPPMQLPRLGHTLSPLLDGRILVVGGQVRPGPAAELYDPRADSWSVVAP